MRNKRSRCLVGRIDHDAEEAGRGTARRNAGEVRRSIGEEHGDEPHSSACHWPQGRHRSVELTGKETDLDNVRATGGCPLDRSGHDLGPQREIANRGADRAPARHCARDFGQGGRIDASQGSDRRFLRVDDVGAARHGEHCFMGGSNAREKTGHALTARLPCASHGRHRDAPPANPTLPAPSDPPSFRRRSTDTSSPARSCRAARARDD